MINRFNQFLTSKRPSTLGAIVWIVFIISGTTLAVTAIPLAHFLKSMYLTKKKALNAILEL